MARFKNVIFVVLLIFFFVEILIVFPQYLEKIEADPAPQEEEADLGSGAEQKMADVHLVESQKGARDWELHAKAAEGYLGKGAWELTKARVQFYNQEKSDFTVVGNKGTIDTKTKDMKILGDVKLTSVNEYIFESKEVFYRSQTRQLVSPGPILMTTPKDQQGDEMIVRGSEMTVFLDESRMLVKNDVKANKNLKDAKRFEVNSETAEFSGRSREAHFTGHVVIFYNQTKIEAPKASFIYSKDKNNLKNIIFIGGVRVSDEDKYALSDEMNLDVEGNKFTFTGRPRVYQDNDELTGEQIVFLDGGKKVRVEKINARVENKSK